MNNGCHIPYNSDPQKIWDAVVVFTLHVAGTKIMTINIEETIHFQYEHISTEMFVFVLYSIE